MSAPSGFHIVALAALTAVLAAPLTIASLIWCYGARMLLRLAGARLLSPGEEPDLVRIVQNLCIGAGLPLPRIHLVESMAANAFATGTDPRNASLVVTRGLLKLLDRRELEAVIAHELSHIGNHDIRLTTTLAALVGIANLPLRSLRFRMGWPLVLLGVHSWFWLLRGILSFSLGFGAVRQLPAIFWWASVAGPSIYVMFVSPVMALLIRQAVSRQREFLADADAVLLTRDPEALALALAKVSATDGNRLSVGEGSIHLYFVDPIEQGASVLHRMFPSHPPVQERIELLARMGNGIAPSALKAAREAGEQIRDAARAADEAVTDPFGQTDGLTPRDDGFVRIYERPDGQSRVLAFLAENAAVKVEGRDGDFVRVTTDDGVTGYVVRSVRLRIQHAATSDDALIPMYERPDGWSRVLAELPANAILTLGASEGPFIRVMTAEHRAGYVSSSAPLNALKNRQLDS
jgi:heat shock protein HtpX